MKFNPILLLIFLWLLPGPYVLGDDFRPALLVINQAETNFYSMTWKAPLIKGFPISLHPRLPSNLKQVGATATYQVGQAVIEKSNWAGKPDALVGATIKFPGLSMFPMEVIIRVNLADGVQHSSVLTATAEEWIIPTQASSKDVAIAYWKIGTIHILEGLDHLLFVFLLMLIVSGPLMLVKTITAFTIAHSLTLALASLELVNIPSPPVEAVIALSILFLALEVIRNREGELTFTERRPWLVSLLFGLVHGLGFAGALNQVGLPQGDIPLALLMFNIGVETGQLLFLTVILSIKSTISHLPINLPPGAWRFFPYAIGGIASYWLIERVTSFV